MTKLKFVLWVVVVLVGLRGLLLNVTGLMLFFDPSGAASLSELDVVSEELLSAAEFALSLILYAFLFILAFNKPSVNVMLAASVAAIMTHEWSMYAWYFVEYVLPYLYLLALLVTPALFLSVRRFRSAYRFTAWFTASASLALLVLFHYILIVGAGDHLKAQSKSLTHLIAQAGADSAMAICHTTGQTCYRGDAKMIGDLDGGRFIPYLAKIRKDDLGKNAGCLTDSFDTRKNTTGLPAGKNEVFFTLCNRNGEYTLVPDTRIYPESRERIVGYSSLLVIFANMAWYLMMVGTLFFHRKKFAARRRAIAFV